MDWLCFVSWLHLCAFLLQCFNHHLTEKVHNTNIFLLMICRFIDRFVVHHANCGWLTLVKSALVFVKSLVKRISDGSFIQRYLVKKNAMVTASFTRTRISCLYRYGKSTPWSFPTSMSFQRYMRIYCRVPPKRQPQKNATGASLRPLALMGVNKKHTSA